MDLLLDEKEDIIFEKCKENNKLCINFSINNPLIIRFYTEKSKRNIKRDGLTVSFVFSNKDEYINKIVVDNEEIKHLIKYTLKTELGEIDSLSDCGSTINLYKHKDYLSSDKLEEIAEVIKKDISDILPDCDVICKNELSTGNFFCQNINVYIYDTETGLLILSDTLSNLIGGY